jgi:3-deoxy-manno-octulosonate cytidylyltransferase (CMP-KDO synthetase)
MRKVVIIPARFKSTRLPGKPLADINGKSMIQHVYERAKQANVDDVIVACDNKDVFNCIQSFSGKAVMTRENHINGVAA